MRKRWEGWSTWPGLNWSRMGQDLDGSFEGIDASGADAALPSSQPIPDTAGRLADPIVFRAPDALYRFASASSTEVWPPTDVDALFAEPTTWAACSVTLTEYALLLGGSNEQHVASSPGSIGPCLLDLSLAHVVDVAPVCAESAGSAAPDLEVVEPVAPPVAMSPVHRLRREPSGLPDPVQAEAGAAYPASTQPAHGAPQLGGFELFPSSQPATDVVDEGLAVSVTIGAFDLPPIPLARLPETRSGLPTPRVEQPTSRRKGESKAFSSASKDFDKYRSRPLATYDASNCQPEQTFAGAIPPLPPSDCRLPQRTHREIRSSRGFSEVSTAADSNGVRYPHVLVLRMSGGAMLGTATQAPQDAPKLCIAFSTLADAEEVRQALQRHRFPAH